MYNLHIVHSLGFLYHCGEASKR